MSTPIANATQLAHYVVNRCTRDAKPISNLQLQKILYFLQVVYCQDTGTLLFSEEFEAWQYGPVLPGVYSEYSLYGASPIVEKYPVSEFFALEEIGPFLVQGINYLRSRSPWDLVRLSHADGSPWSEIWNAGKGLRQKIPNELILKQCSIGGAFRWPMILDSQGHMKERGVLPRYSRMSLVMEHR